MKILLNEKPPNWDKLNELFDIDPKRVVVTYGDCLYVPGGGVVDKHLLAHEEVHAKQQRIPAEWWQNFYDNPQFRMEQELEAYAVQYASWCATYHDKNRRFRFLLAIATDLASPQYGSAITQTEAMRRIKALSGVK